MSWKSCLGQQDLLANSAVQPCFATQPSTPMRPARVMFRLRIRKVFGLTPFRKKQSEVAIRSVVSTRGPTIISIWKLSHAMQIHRHALYTSDFNNLWASLYCKGVK